MFIDVTRTGTTRRLRLASAAIAYLDERADTTLIKLIGGETLQVQESVAEIEAAAAPVLVGSAEPLQRRSITFYPADADEAEAFKNAINAISAAHIDARTAAAKADLEAPAAIEEGPAQPVAKRKSSK